MKKYRLFTSHIKEVPRKWTRTNRIFKAKNQSNAEKQVRKFLKDGQFSYMVWKVVEEN